MIEACFPILNPQSSIRNQQSEISNPKSAIRNQQSEISNPKSAIRTLVVQQEALAGPQPVLGVLEDAGVEGGPVLHGQRTVFIVHALDERDEVLQFLRVGLVGADGFG